MSDHEQNRFNHNKSEALQKSESYLKAVLDNVLDGIISNNEDRLVETFNPAAERIFGYTAAEVIGRNVRMLMPEPYHSQHDTYVNNYLRTGKAKIIGIGREVQGLRKNGQTFPLDLAVSETRRGGQRRFIGILRDITERKQAQEALQQLNASLEQRVTDRTKLAEARAKQLQNLAVELIKAEEKERQRIADLLHDDLQQVLAGALMQLEANQEGLSPQPTLSTVHRLLEESLIKSRRLSHELSPAVLHHSGLAAALEWLAQHVKEQFGLQVQLENYTAEQFESESVKVFLFRAMQEILFNIVKHAGVKKAHVVLFSSPGLLRITISDRGRGFDPDILNNPTRTVGFGLMSIRERASYIGGDFAIESDPGQGSRFTLTVPISIINSEQQQQIRDERPTTTAEPKIGAGVSGINVLFVDDHQVIRQGLIQLVSRQRCINVVGEAADGLEAIEQVRQLKPDVVVMDVSMPGMDGIEATRRIKSAMPQVRIMGLSMYDDEQIAKTMRQAGAEILVSKTASSAELLKAIYGIVPDISKALACVL